MQSSKTFLNLMLCFVATACSVLAGADQVGVSSNPATQKINVCGYLKQQVDEYEAQGKKVVSYGRLKEIIEGPNAPQTLTNLWLRLLDEGFFDYEQFIPAALAYAPLGAQIGTPSRPRILASNLVGSLLIGLEGVPRANERMEIIYYECDDDKAQFYPAMITEGPSRLELVDGQNDSGPDSRFSVCYGCHLEGKAFHPNMWDFSVWVSMYGNTLRRQPVFEVISNTEREKLEEFTREVESDLGNNDLEHAALSRYAFWRDLVNIKVRSTFSSNIQSDRAHILGNYNMTAFNRRVEARNYERILRQIVDYIQHLSPEKKSQAIALFYKYIITYPNEPADAAKVQIFGNDFKAQPFPADTWCGKIQRGLLKKAELLYNQARFLDATKIDSDPNKSEALSVIASPSLHQSANYRGRSIEKLCLGWGAFLEFAKRLNALGEESTGISGTDSQLDVFSWPLMFQPAEPPPMDYRQRREIFFYELGGESEENYNPFRPTQKAPDGYTTVLPEVLRMLEQESLPADVIGDVEKRKTQHCSVPGDK